MKRIHLYIFLIIISVSIIYARTHKYEFVDIDDKRLVVNNPLVTDSSIPYSQVFDKFKYTIHYKPLVFLTWKTGYHLFGESPSHFHVVNWLVHVFNSIILFFIGIQLFTHLFHEQKKALLLSLFLTLLFSLSPLRIESVAWITERKDVLFSFFFLLAWHSYNHFVKNPAKYFYVILAAFFYLLGGLSKSMALTFLAIPFLMDFYFKRKLTGKMIIEKIPFFLVFVMLLYLYGLFDFTGTTHLTEMAGEKNTELESRISSHDFINTLPFFIQWILSSSLQFILWIIHILIPVKLSITYPHDQIFGFLGHAIFLFPVIAVLIYLFLFVKKEKYSKILFGFLFFGFTLGPALLIPISGRALFLADRYTYIPSIGIFFILVYLIDRIKSQTSKYFIFSVLLLFNFLISLGHINNWENTKTLFSHSSKIAAETSFIYLGLGNYERENNNPDKAIVLYEKALNYNPDDYILLNNLGIAYGQKGKITEALKYFDNALKINPDYPEALSNRGNVYFKLKRFDELVQDYKHYLELKPNDDFHHYKLSLAYYTTGLYNEALTHFNTAITLNSNNPDYYYMRSYVFNALGNKEEALNDVLKAQEMGKQVNQEYIENLKIK